MKKFLEKVQEAESFVSLAGGLGLAKTICRRKLLEADTKSSQYAVLSIIEEIDKLITIAQKKAIKSAK